jgi:hypothetical protein
VKSLPSTDPSVMTHDRTIVSMLIRHHFSPKFITANLLFDRFISHSLLSEDQVSLLTIMFT